jgi:ATP-dependent DNA ligase
MLAGSGEIPPGSGWLFEPKLDGSAASTARTTGYAPFPPKWDMTALLPELHRLPPDVPLDGEIVALDEKGCLTSTG